MGERVLPSVPSLVKYSVPEIVSVKKKAEPSKSKKVGEISSVLFFSPFSLRQSVIETPR